MMTFILGIMIGIFALPANGQDTSFLNDHTPKEIKTFVTRHFPSSQIIKYKKKVDFSKIEYEVKLNDRVELEFDQNFDLKEAESKFALPESIIPENVLIYIHQNYAGMKIQEWERKSYGQKIELTSGLDLYFDENGHFLRAK